jgi:tripartite-type tricarboxylate transporter receptor subunit TctC
MRTCLNVRTIILAFALSVIAAVTSAQTYPTRAIRLIVPFAPGGGTDILIRVITPKLSELLGQQIIVDNRGGGGSMIGTELVVRSAPDGYTLVAVDTAFATNPSLYRKLPYDPIKDLAPVSLLATAPVILIVHPSVPATTVTELVALAKARPGQLNFASGGAGSSTHLGVELFKYVANIDLVHIPYKGTGPAVADVLGGQVVMMFAGISSVKQHVMAGKLRAIAVTGEHRSPAMPQVPTFTESGLKGVDSGTYWGSLAPAGTPRDIINKVSAAMATAVKAPELHQRLVDLGYDPIGGSPDDFAANIKSEIEKWARVIRAAGVRLD